MFNFNESSSQSNSNNNRRNDAFINLALPNDKGGNSKLGNGVGLSMNNTRSKKLIEWLKPEETRAERLAIIKEHLVLTFNMADGSDQGEFVLPEGKETGLPV